MKARFLCVSLSVMGWTGLGLAAGEPGDAQRVFARVSGSVVTIKTEDDKGVVEAQGSGVVVGKGQVVTNCHVIRNASIIRVLVGQAELEGKWVRQKAALDLCLLTVNGLDAPSVKLRPGSSLAVGEPVFAVGNPLGFGLAVSAGLVATAEQKQPHPYLVATAPQSPGSSGGGLFDREGLLVGVTKAVLGTGQNFNMILSADSVAGILANGDAPPAELRLPAPEKPWIADADALRRAARWADLEMHARAWSVSQPRSAVAAATLGTALQGLKRLDEAEVSVRRALELDENYAPAWLQLADLLYLRGAREAAEQALKALDSRYPFSSDSVFLRAHWFRDAGRLTEAREHIRESIRRWPRRSEAWRFLGLVEDSLGNPVEASRALATALRLGDADVRARQRLAELYAKSGKVEEAARLAQAQEVASGNTGKTQLLMGLGELNRGRLGPAEEAMRKAVALLPEAAEAWTGLGAVLMRLGHFQEAESAFDKALQLAPRSADNLTNRAGARLELKRLQPALDDARQAIKLDPQSAQGWRIAALTHLALGKPREAGMAFQKLDGLVSMNPDELVSWAEAMIGMGSVDEALKILSKAEAMDPKLLRMCLTMARAQGAKGDIAAALGYEIRALEIDPVNVHAWSGKGYALMKLGRLPEAVDALETAVRLDPGLSNGWINLGEVQLRSRNLGRAIQSLEKALTLAPAASDARFFLAQAYLGARLPKKAREHAEVLLVKQPTFAPALGVVTMSYLVEGNGQAASEAYLKLKASAPTLARTLRAQALGAGLAGAGSLPE